MTDHQRVAVQLQQRVGRGDKVTFLLRREIKRVAEEAKHQRRTWSRLDADLDVMNSDSDAQRAVIVWIRILRLHVMDWSGRGRCRRRPFSFCNTCTLLSYLCTVFMNPNKPSQYAAFQRRVLSWTATLAVWPIILGGVFRLLSSTHELNQLGDIAVVSIFAAVVATLFASTALFVKETLEKMPYDSPPFLPLWLDGFKRVRLRRRQALLAVADIVLELHGAVRPAVCSVSGACRFGLPTAACSSVGGRVS